MRYAKLTSLAALSCVVGFWTPLSFAQEVARWVDAEGVTHFGDPQFASATATMIEIGPTNGMDVPSAVPQLSYGRPRFYRINKAPKVNKGGFRGHRRRGRKR